MGVTTLLTIVVILQLAVIIFKDRLLNLLSIYIAILALVPFIYSIGLYYGETPIIAYEVFSKYSTKEGDEYVNDFDIAVSSIKDNIILRDRGLAVGELMEGKSSIGLHPKYCGKIKILGMREGKFFIGDTEESLLEKKVQLVSGYRVTTEKQKDKISVKYLLNAKLDISKLGVLCVFQPNYEYRLVADIPIDFKSSLSQRGYFKKVD